VRYDLRIVSITAVTILSLTTASVAIAQSSRSQPTSATKKQARAAYTRAQELYQAGKYEEAESYFNKAFEAVPNPVVLLSIAETQKKLDRAPEAVATLETYLELRPDAPNREEIEQKIKDLRALPAKIDVASDPPGAEILVDGAGVGKVTPALLEVSAGDHTISLSLPGKSPARQVVSVQFGTRHELQLALQSEPTEPIPTKSEDFMTPPESTPEAVTDNGTNLTPWIVTGVGVVAIGTGAVLGVMALGDKSDFDKNPTKKNC